jgi:hypothetical protein
MSRIDVLAVMDKAIDGVNMRISPEHAAWNMELRAARMLVSELIRNIHNLGLLYEAGCDIDNALAELEQLAEEMGGSK